MTTAGQVRNCFATFARHTPRPIPKWNNRISRNQIYVMEDLIYSAVHRSSKWASCLEVSRECSAELGRSERQVAFCSMLMQISIIKSTTEAKAPKTPTYISLKQNSLYAENVKSTALSAPAAMQLRMWAKNSLDNIQFIRGFFLNNQSSSFLGHRTSQLLGRMGSPSQ